MQWGDGSVTSRTCSHCWKRCAAARTSDRVRGNLYRASLRSRQAFAAYDSTLACPVTEESFRLRHFSGRYSLHFPVFNTATVCSLA
jgi:hypothetical protein